MINLRQKSIFFCEEERKFKRCPNKVLRDASKGAEQIIKDLREKTREYQVLGQDLLKKQNELSSADEKQAKKLQKEIVKLEKKVEEENEIMEQFVKDSDIKLIEEYDKLCMLLLEPFKEGEFIEKHDSIDMIIVENMNMFYDMSMSGIKDSEIEDKIRELVNTKHAPQSFR